MTPPWEKAALNKSVDQLLGNRPRPRETRDLIADIERRARRAHMMLLSTIFAAGVTTGGWLTLILTRP